MQKEAQIIDTPVTVAEWARYIGKLDGRKLTEEARAANQVAFVRTLEGDGLGAKEISSIFDLFAARFVQAGVPAPGRLPGAYLDFRSLVEQLSD